MSTQLLVKERPDLAIVDRPGWIPPHIFDNWDPSPYAYQTEEELMPAGGLHGRTLSYILEMIRHFVEARGLMFLLDVFMLYRDTSGRKQRIAPDLLLMPFEYPPPSAYDLDVQPPPRLVIEVTSPSSQFDDKQTKVDFYAGLGIETYLVIDAITSGNRLRHPIKLYLWRLRNGQPQAIAANVRGGFALPEIGLQIWVAGQRIHFADLATGQDLRDMDEILHDMDEVVRERDEERQAKEAAEARAAAAEARIKEIEAKSSGRLD